MRLSTCLWLLGFGLAIAFEQDATFHEQVSSCDPNAKFVAFGARHGNRNPSKVIEGSEKVFGEEGELEVTAFGKRQAYILGQRMREFIGALVDSNYLPKESEFFASSASRTQMTLQLATAGIYRPTSFAHWSNAVDWSPVPYAINDPMLRMYAVKECPKSKEAWKPIDDETLPEMVAAKESNKDLLQYLADNTGWKPTLGSAADLADNLDQYKVHTAAYPDWVSHSALSTRQGANLADDYFAFQEYPQIMCAKYGPCQQLMSGVWLQKLSEYLVNLQNTTAETPKLVGFASHTEITLAAMLNMGILAEKLETTGGFVLEARDQPSWQARLLVHEPVKDTAHMIIKAKYGPELSAISDADGWMPVGSLISHLQSKGIKDWKSACGAPSDCTSPLTASAPASASSPTATQTQTQPQPEAPSNPMATGNQDAVAQSQSQAPLNPMPQGNQETQPQPASIQINQAVPTPSLHQFLAPPIEVSGYN